MQTCLHAVFCEAEYAVDKAYFENTFSKIRLINGTSVNSYYPHTIIVKTITAIPPYSPSPNFLWGRMVSIAVMYDLIPTFS